LNLPNLPIRLALDLSSGTSGAHQRRASQLVIDQRGLTLKFASNPNAATFANVSPAQLMTRSNSVIALSATPTTHFASTPGETKSDAVIDPTTSEAQQAGISLTLTKDGELSVCPDGSQTPFVHLKISPQFLLSSTSRSRQNSLCSDQPPLVQSTLVHPLMSAVHSSHEPTVTYSNLMVGVPKMFGYSNAASDHPQGASSTTRETYSKLYLKNASQYAKEAHILSSSKGNGGHLSSQVTLPIERKGMPNSSLDTIIDPDLDLLAKVKQKRDDQRQSPERLSQVLGEMIMPFLLAGLGNVATGWLLSNVQTWPVFLNVPQLIILIPALLGLKGNVEMTLASRLSTHANLGDLDRPEDRRELISGNLALVQCQSSTVGFLAPLIALAISYINPDEDDILTFHEAILLMAASVITANIANLILSLVMFVVIFVCRQMDINPDNVATPIAASLGTLVQHV
jgi:cation transporter-like permease